MKGYIAVFLTFILLLQINIPVQAAEINKEESISIESKKGDNLPYKNIQITKSNGSYIVTGIAKVRKGIFYYMVEDGHNILVPEKKVKINNLHWTTFQLNISIPNEKLPKNGSIILFLYEKDRSGTALDQQPVVLDTFKK